MRTHLNAEFNNQQHFVNYCRKIATGKMGHASHVGRRKFTEMLRQIWRRQNPEEIENFIYKLKKATPEQLELSLTRLRGTKKKISAPYTGMYGIWSAVSKQFVFGIQRQSKSGARHELRERIGKNSLKYRFEVKRIKDCEEHRAMFRQGLKYKKDYEVAE